MTKQQGNKWMRAILYIATLILTFIVMNDLCNTQNSISKIGDVVIIALAWDTVYKTYKEKREVI